MQRLKIALVAGIMALASLLGAFAPQVAKAGFVWPEEVIISSSQARFEVQTTNYDAATNKYQYKFSWLIPARRTYSFMIDGKTYNPRVTANGVAETPYWFSPDVTYTIQVYPYANGRGAMVASGTFKVPAAPASASAALTIEQEYELFGEYMYATPDLPKKTMKKSASDVAYITNLIESTFSLATIAETMPYLSSASAAALSQTPLFVKEIDSYESDSVLAKPLDYKNIKIYQGGQYASFSYKLKNKSTGKTSTSKLVYIKENGQWKFDFLQTMKLALE